MTQGRDARLGMARDGDEAHANRALENREVTEDRELTDEERLDALRLNQFTKQLPDLHVEGFHCAWLTTTNPRDSIATRRKMGYEFITESDMPEFAGLSMKTAEYPGAIAVNEMIAMKLPMRLYEKYMKYLHHDSALAEEDKLNAVLIQIKEEAERKRARVDVMQGTDELGRDVRRPTFEGTTLRG